MIRVRKWLRWVVRKVTSIYCERKEKGKGMVWSNRISETGNVKSREGAQMSEVQTRHRGSMDMK
jgi:cob(I)alamin adenosyltransferase